MGFIVRTAVNHRSIGSRHLHHRAVIVLTEGIGCKRRRVHIVHIVHQGGGIGFSGKVDARLSAKAKEILVLDKPLFSNHKSHLHQCVIAGLHQGFFHRQGTVTVAVYTVNIIPAHMLIAVAHKAFIALKHPFFQGSGNGKNLLRRTRLIGVADAEIPPDLVPGHQHSQSFNLFIAVVVSYLGFGELRFFLMFIVIIVNRRGYSKLTNLGICIVPLQIPGII